MWVIKKDLLTFNTFSKRDFCVLGQKGEDQDPDPWDQILPIRVDLEQCSKEWANASGQLILSYNHFNNVFWTAAFRIRSNPEFFCRKDQDPIFSLKTMKMYTKNSQLSKFIINHILSWNLLNLSLKSLSK